MENSLKETEVDKEQWEEKKREQEAKKSWLGKRSKSGGRPDCRKNFS